MVGMSLVDALRLVPRHHFQGGAEPPPTELNLPGAMFLTLFGGVVLMLVALGIGSLFKTGAAKDNTPE
jgi:hypothetical protein